jgi:hypothetical protein
MKSNSLGDAEGYSSKDPESLRIIKAPHSELVECMSVSKTAMLIYKIEFNSQDRVQKPGGQPNLNS